jgi:hypothetical protein
MNRMGDCFFHFSPASLFSKFLFAVSNHSFHFLFTCHIFFHISSFLGFAQSRCFLRIAARICCVIHAGLALFRTVLFGTFCVTVSLILDLKKPHLSSTDFSLIAVQSVVARWSLMQGHFALFQFRAGLSLAWAVLSIVRVISAQPPSLTKVKDSLRYVGNN